MPQIKQLGNSVTTVTAISENEFHPSSRAHPVSFDRSVHQQRAVEAVGGAVGGRHGQVLAQVLPQPVHRLQVRLLGSVAGGRRHHDAACGPREATEVTARAPGRRKGGWMGKK